MSDTSTVKPLWPWLERLVAWGSDRSNPMLVRCVRQELRSRTFIAGYILALAVAMVAALIVAKVSADDIERGREAANGGALFLSLTVVWSFILVPVQAGMAFRTITLERQQDTWDLVELTGMRPSLIIRGLLLTTIVQAMLYTTALAPYMMLAYLLRGIDLMQMVAAMIMVIGCSVFTASCGAFGGTLVQGKQGKGFIGLVIGIGSFFLWWGLQGALWSELDKDVANLLADLARFDGEAWTGLLAMLNGWVAAIALCLVLAASQLTHRAGDRSSAPRTLFFLIVACAIGWSTSLFWVAPGFDPEDFCFLAAIILSIAAVILGFFSTTEDEYLSPRQAQVINQAEGANALRMAFCGPGACRGHRAYLALALPAVICALISLSLGGDDEPNHFAILVVAYSAMIFGGCDLLFRAAGIPGIATPLHRRSLVFATIMALSLLPLLLAWVISGNDIDQNPLVMLSPFFGIGMTLSNSSDREARIIGMAVVGGLGLVRIVAMALRSDIRLQRIRARHDDRNPREP